MVRAIVFPGQGAQHPGMGLAFAEEEPAARRVFEIASQVLGFDLEEKIRNGDAAELARTDVCQPAILAVSAAAVTALEARGLLDRGAFAATAGLSLGEYTALWFAGSIALEDALRVVQRRGRAMQRASLDVESGMVALLGGDLAAADRLVAEARGDRVLVLANLLAERNVAVSGERAALDRVCSLASSYGFRRAVELDVAGAFHSPLMASATRELEEALAGVTISPPRVPFYSNVTGTRETEPERIRDLLAQQVTAPVLWLSIASAFMELGVQELWEPAPGRVLTGLARKAFRGGLRTVNFERPADVEGWSGGVHSREASS